jgi:hypothetical protein
MQPPGHGHFPAGLPGLGAAGDWSFRPAQHGQQAFARLAVAAARAESTDA